jgi:moderate conductance mechanosensitive channel
MRLSILTPLTLALVFVTIEGARAQGLPTIPLPGASTTALPSGVSQEGPYLTTPVTLDGVTLFRISTPAAGDDQMSVEARAEFIEAALNQLLALRGSAENSGTDYDPATLRVEIEPDGPQAILAAADAKHETPVPILTVTGADAKYQGQPTATLAQQWRGTLQTAIVAALERRQPAVLARDVGKVWIVGAVLIALTTGLAAVLIGLGKRLAGLSERVEADERAIDKAQSQNAGDEPVGSGRRRRFMGLAMRAADPAMTLSMVRALRGVLIWFLVLLWFAGVVWALSLFPQTTPLGETIFTRATRIAFTWIGAALLMRIIAIVVVQVARAYGARNGKSGSDESARRLLRVPTVSNTIVAIVGFVVYFVAILATLSLLGISTGSVLTLGGLVALAVSLAAQNLVRDFLNGFLVLVEDQYVVGDYVIIGDRSGIVEHMSLRVVQLRDGAGNLVTIPHSAATEVVNCSRNWSRVDYRISIDAGADAKRALDVLRRTVTELAGDASWHGAVVEPVEWVGVDSVSTAGIVVRASVKTAPLRQFEIKRELNARLIDAFRRAGIPLGSKDAYAA